MAGGSAHPLATYQDAIGNIARDIAWRDDAPPSWRVGGVNVTASTRGVRAGVASAMLAGMAIGSKRGDINHQWWLALSGALWRRRRDVALGEWATRKRFG